MKQIWSVAKLSFRLPFRRGGGWLLCGLTMAVAVFMFLVSRSDGVLVNELRLRIRFGLLFSTSLFSLALLWCACISMRGDLDAKRLQMLTAYPIKRAYIYIGKWLGLFMFAGAGLLGVMVAVAVPALIMIQTWDKPDELAALKRDYWRVHREVRPIIADAHKLALEEAAGLKLAGKFPTDQPEYEVLNAIKAQIIRRQQLVPRNGQRRWPFRLGRAPRYGEEFILRYRFYAHERQPVTGRWAIAVSQDGSHFYQVAHRPISAQPFKTHELRFPTRLIPPNGELIVIFQGIDNPGLIFYNSTGLKLYYDNGAWPGNLAVFFLVGLAHFAVVITVGLTVATAFTFSVACFVSTVLYFLALASDFFGQFLRESQVEGRGSFGEAIVGGIIKLGLFLTTGMEPPNAVYPLSEAISITPDQLGMYVTRATGAMLFSPLKVFSESLFASFRAAGLDLFAGFLFYFLLISFLGIWLLTRKELDRIH